MSTTQRGLFGDEPHRPTLRDILDERPPSNGTPTSDAAAESIAPAAGILREQVFSAIAAAPDGLMDEEIQERLGMNPSTERPRRGELVAEGRIRAATFTRTTRSGRHAIVWLAL